MYLRVWGFHLSFFFYLTFDSDVSKQALFLLSVSALSLAHIKSLILQPYGFNVEVQDPVVGALLEGGLALKRCRVEVRAPAVQLLALTLLIQQGLGVEAVPLQLIVEAIVSFAAQRHFLLLQGIFRRMNIDTEALGDGFEDKRVGL